MIDFKATLHDGASHDVDSSEMAFKIAGSMGFKEGAQKASPVLLEPIMKVEVVTPDEYYVITSYSIHYTKLYEPVSA